MLSCPVPYYPSNVSFTVCQFYSHSPWSPHCKHCSPAGHALSLLSALILLSAPSPVCPLPYVDLVHPSKPLLSSLVSTHKTESALVYSLAEWSLERPCLGVHMDPRFPVPFRLRFHAYRRAWEIKMGYLVSYLQESFWA